MSFIRAASALALVSTVCMAAPPGRKHRGEAPREPGRLVYRIQMRKRGETVPMEMRFALVPTPALVTRNHVHKPRFGSWRLEPLQGKDAPWIQTLLLARAERLMYFSSPAPQTLPEKAVIRYGERLCPVWKVEGPKNLGFFVYLVEAQPNLLVLSYLSGNFPEGEIAAVELQLESISLKAGTAPPEDGLALLQTLKRWSQPGQAGFAGLSPDGGSEAVN